MTISSTLWIRLKFYTPFNIDPLGRAFIPFNVDPLNRAYTPFNVESLGRAYSPFNVDPYVGLTLPLM